MTGCTTKIDPEGNEGDEWCKIADGKDGKVWDKCREDLDMDNVR